MITWDNAIDIMQRGAKAADADSTSYLVQMANVGYKYILGDFGRPVTEKTRTATTVAAQQYYQFPMDVIFPKTITITIGGTIYSMTSEPSQDVWNQRNSQPAITSNIPQCYFIRHGFGVTGTEVGLWPIPSSSGNTLTMVYEASAKDLSNTRYTTGTMSVAVNAAAVTGSGTSWTKAMEGRYLRVTSATGDGFFYKIVLVGSTTSITLENVYEGIQNESGATYEVVELFLLPEEMQILPCYYSLMHWYQTKSDQSKTAEYKTLFDQGMTMAKSRWGQKTRGALVMESQKAYGSSYPLYFPTNIT